jgi:hypothetical protein
MAKRFVTCSWCHEQNELHPVHKTYCICGHRADVPRIECDCRLCRRRDKPQPAPEKRKAAAA